MQVINQLKCSFAVFYKMPGAATAPGIVSCWNFYSLVRTIKLTGMSVYLLVKRDAIENNFQQLLGVYSSYEAS